MVGGAGSGAAENHLRRGVRRTDRAYQPKFARKNHRVSPFFVLLGVIVVPISLALTAVLLGKMAHSLSRPKATAQAAPENMAIMEQFDGFVSAKMDAARDTLTAAQAPENVPETTVPVREKVIIEIPDDAQVAPEPNPECYGQTDDPASLQWLLDEAAFLLDGQELYLRGICFWQSASGRKETFAHPGRCSA